MMFSNNGKISDHQAVRLMILDLFTGACLFLPMALSRVAGNGGLFSCILGILWVWIEGVILSKIIVSGEHVNILWGKQKVSHLIRCILGFRCLATYIFLMGLFVQVLSETFLYTMPKWLIITGMVLVLLYGGTKGLEVRARLSEILFYLVLIPIVCLGLFSLPEAEWLNLLKFSDITWRGVFEGALITWVLMAPLEWILYIETDISHGLIKKIFRYAIGIGGGLILLIYGICQSVLDVNGMAAERWPTVILMQIIKIPGGFLSRQDGLMLSFWIFAMFISLSGALGHAAELLGGNQKERKMGWIAGLGIGGGIIAGFIGMNRSVMNIYFYGMILTGILMIGIVLLIYILWKNKGSKRWMGLMVILLSTFGLFGCENYVELENRSFIMAIGIDSVGNGQYRLTYALPDLAKLTGNGSSDKESPISIEAGSLEEAEKIFNRMSEKVMDYGQVKVFVFGNNLVSDMDGIEKLVHEIKNKQEVARTVLVCLSQTTAQEVIQMDEEIGTSIGMYIENLMNNHHSEVIFNTFMQNPSLDQLPQITVKNHTMMLNGSVKY